MKLYYVFIGYTESGDDTDPYIWDHNPSEAEINLVLKRDWPEDYEADTIWNWDVFARELETGLNEI